MNRYISKFICAVIILFVQHSVSAQQEAQMLMYKIDENSYQKKSFDKEGNIKSNHLIKVGELVNVSETYEIKVSYYTMDKNNMAKDSTFTKFSCNPRDAKMLVNIIPLFTDIADKTIRVVSLSGSKSLYPKFEEQDTVLQDISFKIEIEGGLQGFLGTSGVIKIYNRKFQHNENDLTKATLTSQIEMKAYLLGIRVKKVDYIVTEQLNNKIGIVQQDYKSKTGEYFTIKLTNK